MSAVEEQHEQHQELEVGGASVTIGGTVDEKTKQQQQEPEAG